MKIHPFILLLLHFFTISAFAQQNPNIVILYADDLGYGDFKPNNPATKIPMPNLEKLASEGINFTDAHSSSGICSPSRYALLTGRAHWRDFHGIDRGFDPTFFKPGQLTLPEMLRHKGYSTACIGKWHLGWDWNSIRKPGSPPNSKQYNHFDWTKPFRGGPIEHGFDFYFGDNVINFPPYTWIENDRVLAAPDMTFENTPQNTKEGQWECRVGPGRSDWDFYQVLPTLTERAVSYIHSRKQIPEPFFLYFPLPSPHAPIVPNDEFDGKSQAGPYGDFVYQTDDACGRILKALDDIGQTNNTIVIFSADNGPENYCIARKEKFDHWSSEPLRGQKRHIHEGGHRVPTVMRWPGVIKPGTTSNSLFAQTDLMATFATLVGYQLPKNSADDSYDYLPYLRGETEKAPRTSMVHNTSPNAYAIRDGDWVLVNVTPSSSKQKIPQPIELYNLKEDISQKNNLAKKHPEQVVALQKLLDKIHTQGHSAPRLD